MVGVLDLDPPIEGRPVHLWHAGIRKNQIVGVGAELIERRLPTRNRVHLAESITPHHTDNEITEDHIVINDKDARTLKTGHMYITVRAPIAWFAISKVLATDRTE
jgi:hypothetical protein